MDSAKVVVGIGKSRSSKGALKWALENLVSCKDVITLLHICPPVRTIPTPTKKQVLIEEVSKEIVAAYLRDVQSKIDEFLQAYKLICDSYKVETECVVAENDSVHMGLLGYVSKYRIRKLVLGTSARNVVTRKLMRPGLSLRISKDAPEFCSVLLISKHRLHSVKDRKSHTSIPDSMSSASESDDLVVTRLNEQSLSSLLKGEIEVGSKGKEFEQAIVRLTKTWAGHSQPLPVQKRHASSLPNYFSDCSLSLPSAFGHNFAGSNESESIFTEGFPEKDLQSYLSELRSGDFLEDSCSCSSGANSLDQRLWKGSDSMSSSHVRNTSLDNIRRPLGKSGVAQPQSSSEEDSRSLHHNLKASDSFSTSTRTSSIHDFLQSTTNSVPDFRFSVKNYISSEKEGSHGRARRAAILCHNLLFLMPIKMPNQFSPESRKEELELLREQLEKALRLVETARKDANIQASFRIKAEKAAIWAAQKAEEFAAKQLEEAKKGEEALKAAVLARELAAEESRKLDKAIAAAQLARRTAKLEAKRRKAAETRFLQETEARKAAIETLQLAQQRFREYDYEELKAATDNFSEDLKLGEGGYGVVYKGKLHHMTVAIKVLKENGFQGPQHFEHEVEILCHIHHPYMVLLLGCCPEKGCLVYEYMANGSLEDWLIRKGTRTPLPWWVRFRIIAEVASALHFLHSTRPEPIVHRDFKPGNILLDHNLVSKLSDVGLARLVPERSADIDTLNPLDTVPMGTFAYIDPEYQRTGVFGAKSDVYALGIVMLQMLTGKPAMGVHEVVEEALNNERLYEVLDDSAGEWPHIESMEFASLALQCAEMKRKQRPDLESGVLPILDRIRVVAEDFTVQQAFVPPISKQDKTIAPARFLCPMLQEVMENPVVAADGYTYDYKAIKQWFEEHNTSPLTNVKLRHKLLTPNHALRTVIREWQAKTMGSCS